MPFVPRQDQNPVQTEQPQTSGFVPRPQEQQVSPVNLPKSDTPISDMMIQHPVLSAAKSAMEDTAKIPVDMINAYGGNVARGEAQTFSQAVNSDAVLPLPKHVEQASIDYPTTAKLGLMTGNIKAYGEVAALTGGAINPLTRAVLPTMMQDGLLTGTAINGITNALMSGGSANDRLFAGAIGSALGAGGTIVGQVIGKVVSMWSGESKLNKIIGGINSTIQGSPDEAAVKGVINKYNIVNGITEQKAKILDEGTVNNTIPMGAISTAKQLIAQSENPKNLTELSPGTQKVLETVTSWEDKPFSFAELRNTRQQIDQLLSQASKQTQNGAIARNEYQVLNTLKKGVEKDLELSANRSNLKQEYLDFNEHYKANELPLINAGFRDVVDQFSANNLKTDPKAAAQITDQWIKENINPNNPKTTQWTLQQLDPNTRHSIEVKLINDAYQNAHQSNGVLDMLTFQKNYNDMNKAVPGLFSKETKQMMRGANEVIKEANSVMGMQIDLAKISPYTKMATTVALTSGLGGGGYLGGMLGAVPAIVAAKLIQMINTPAGQDALINVSTKGGREAAQLILNSMVGTYSLDQSKKMSQPPSNQMKTDKPTGTIGIRN